MLIKHKIVSKNPALQDNFSIACKRLIKHRWGEIMNKKKNNYIDDKGVHKFKSDPVGYTTIIIAAVVIAVMVVLDVLMIANF